MFAPEGLGFIALSIALLAIFLILALWRRHAIWIVFSLVALLLCGGMIFFFRDPSRPVPDAAAIVSPSDGHVLSVESMPEGGIHLVIFLSLLDVHAIRAPMRGKVVSAEYFPGKFHFAHKPEAGRENEHIRVEIETTQGTVVMRVLAGKLVRRVVCHLLEGDLVYSGQRVGFVRFGSRAELEFPPGFHTNLKKGDKVIGGVTLIGTFNSLPEEVLEPAPETGTIHLAEPTGA